MLHKFVQATTLSTLLLLVLNCGATPVKDIFTSDARLPRTARDNKISRYGATRLESPNRALKPEDSQDINHVNPEAINVEKRCTRCDPDYR